jgi:predicted dehydrogenase
VHTLDQIISIWGRPEAVSYDIRSLRNKQNPDDTFEAQLFYGDRKAIVKTSHLVMSEYPKFIVHGTRGSFIKYGVDQQESFLKADIMPDADGFGRDHRLGLLEYIDENGTQHKEAVVNEQGDYGQVYDSVYESIVNAKPAFISEFEAITNLEILERAFSQPSPATIRLEQVEK